MLAAFLLYGLASLQPANACATPCTKAQLATDIATNWPDNTTGQITPALLRSTVLELVNSYLDTNGTSAFTCTSHQFLNSIATLSTYGCAQPGVGDLSGLGTGVSGALATAANTIGGFVTLVSQTTNVIYKGNGASSPLPSGLTDNGTVIQSAEPISATTNSFVQEIVNAGSTGTTLNKLAKLTGSPATAVIVTTGDTTGNVLGIVIGGAGTTGSAQIAITGQAGCIFDGAITAGHYVQVSTTAAGSCHDAGATFPTAGQVLGFIIAATNGAPGTASQAVSLFPPGIVGSTATSAGTVTTITAGSGIVLSSGSTCTTTCTVSTATPTPQGRLTLVSGQAVMTADAVGITSIWYAPDIGGRIPYFNGTSVTACDFVSSATDQIGLTLALSSTPARAADSIEDVFAYWTGSACALATRVWDASMLPSTPALITPIATATVTGTGANAWTRPNAAFDGTAVKVGASSATIPSGSVNASAANCLGQDYGVGNTNTVTQLVVTAPTDHFVYGNFGWIDFQTSVSPDGTNWYLTNVSWINDTAFGNAYTVPLNTTAVGPWRFIRTCFDGMGDNTRSLFVAQLQYYNTAAASTRRLVRYSGVGLVNDASIPAAQTTGTTTVSIPQYQGTYLGSIHIDTATPGQVSCYVQSFGPSRTCGIWNPYPAAQRWLELQAGIYDPAKNYTINGQGWAACEGSSTYGLQVFTGMAVEPVNVHALRNVVLNSTGGAASYEYGLGVNIGSSTAVTAAFSGTQVSTNFDNTGSVHGLTEPSEVTLAPFAGLQSVTCVERANNGANGSVITITNGVRAAVLKARWRY